ncbi:MAG: galactose mutarotase, partial [Oscillospiraceae bacterium]|nr:galactose mutarotase [Oscillospiraceae bacterium]
YLSEDGENGYPGNLNMEVTYTLTKDGEFSIEYRGVSDEDTILNPTNHTYFNLSGNAKRVIKDHILKVNSDSFIEVNQELIPTGKILDVKNTPFDFKNFKPVSEGMNSNYDQNIIVGNGYDHAFILNKNKNDGLYDIAVYDPVSKRELKVNTISKSVVIYTSNSMGDNFKVNGRNSEKYLGICLETQIEPDAISNPNFSSCILKKGEQFYSKTSFKFDVKQD